MLVEEILKVYLARSLQSETNVGVCIYLFFCAEIQKKKDDEYYGPPQQHHQQRRRSLDEDHEIDSRNSRQISFHNNSDMREDWKCLEVLYIFEAARTCCLEFSCFILMVS